MAEESGLRHTRQQHQKNNISIQSRSGAKNQNLRSHKTGGGVPSGKRGDCKNSQEHLQCNWENVRNRSNEQVEGSTARQRSTRRKDVRSESVGGEWEFPYSNKKGLLKGYDNNGSCYPSFNQSPYAFDLTKEDNEICQQTNNDINDIKKSLYFHPELDNNLTHIYISTNDVLNNYAAHIINEIYYQKQRATEEWLQSRSEEEKMQYRSRLKVTVS
mmetsp:Transcript_5293/g.5437  ORF Transcript_5293/g.5437 Transcript_5293/m.5437 type:complete len:215 (-) Transcript_5293:469-1113(-)|eukprot:CAMPEP_0182427424 /NCGR_PEP_ID=MMETSP1167-20130531/17164_1 /TAXON_ID=2988 /ORGANISM="Mallomonas Sp, Strain CCMP3275" /LENGTH=214 /DNA_ID=CAMNT_0024609647 /DNA_START=164 /DNA_END=808 /DNA_ORIENTATION=-